MEMKECRKCGKTFPSTTEFFGKESKRKDGLKSQCKNCIALQKKEYWKNNKEKLYKQQTEYRKINKAFNSDVWETIHESKKKYYENNKEIIKQNSKKYRDEHKEEYKIKYQNKYKGKYKGRYKKDKEKAHEWNNRNRERIKIYNAKRRNMKRNSPSNLTIKQWDDIKKSFNNCCAYCGKHEKLTVEHFIPLSKGGELTINNILPVCFSCNSSKRDRNFRIWYKQQPFYSIEREKKILEFLRYKDSKQQLSLL